MGWYKKRSAAVNVLKKVRCAEKIICGSRWIIWAQGTPVGISSCLEFFFVGSLFQANTVVGGTEIVEQSLALDVWIHLRVWEKH